MLRPTSEKLDSWIRCIGREVVLRTTALYTQWVKEGSMSGEDASSERETMQEVYEFLKSLNIDGGHEISAEVKKRMSEAQKARWQRQKQSNLKEGTNV